ncbi:MAG TPA: FmdB family zinc ribbon protein [Actinomycetota bacterium]
MPTYEYACLQCGEHVEVYQSFTDEPLSVCPNCGGQLRKVFHPAGILFRGSGFYKTDSRSTPSKSDGGSSGSSEKSTSKTTSSSDSGKGGSSSSGSSGSSGSGGSKQPAGTSKGSS